MSPEQARGVSVDKRTDIWAFGCCLFEALTGAKAFEGETPSDTLSLVLQREPEWGRVPGHVPPHVTRVLRRCLVKDPRQRLRDIGDARVELSSGSVEPEAPNVGEGLSRGGETIVRLAGATTLLAVGLLVGWLVRDETVEPPVVDRQVIRSEIELPSEARLALGEQINSFGFDSPAVALSPDGSVLVYVGRRGDEPVLYRRDMDDPTVSLLPGTEGAVHAFFSPDGAWVGFLTTHQVKKVPLRGGSPVTIADIQTPTRASWTLDDSVYVVSGTSSNRLTRVPSAGGSASEIPVSRASVSQVLPDGRAAFLSSGGGLSADYANVLLLSLETMETRVLVELG